MSYVDGLAARLEAKARSCADGGSPLYGDLLGGAAHDFASRGPTYDVLSPHAGERGDSALELRFAAALHWLVLRGCAPDLAQYFPSVGGSLGPIGAWDAARALVQIKGAEIARLVILPCQTNEVGRSAMLALGMRAVAARWPGVPARLLELGASAGLNLRFDAFLSARLIDASVTGAEFEVDLPQIIERIGCDLNPIDPGTEAGRFRLLSQVWADQSSRIERLRRALDIAGRVSASVEQAGAVSWLEQQLERLPEGIVTVVWHSVVMQYLDEAERHRLDQLFDQAASSASTPLVRLSMEPEPGGDWPNYPLVATVWPGGHGVRLADSDGHAYTVRPTKCRLPDDRRAG